VRLTHADIRADIRSSAGPARTRALPTDDPAPGERPEALFTGALTGPGYWLQLGAFRSRDAATQLQQRLLREAEGLPGVAVFEDAGTFRVQAGPYAGREQAAAASEPLQRQTGLPAFVVQRAAPSLSR
jgi:rare lipoprotein A